MHRVRALAALTVGCVLFLPAPALSARWDIHADGTGDAPTIQDAISLAASGDSVVLGPGTYRGPGNREISFLGKQLVVTSSAGSAATIIDCEGAGRGFIFNSNEPFFTLLEEVTIMNGSAPEGGGIYVYGTAHPWIRRCVITQCNATSGGGIYAGLLADVTVEYNLIVGNTAVNGGGFSDDESYAKVRFNIIRDNTAQLDGGGVDLKNGFAMSYVEDNLIEDNSATRGGGIRVRAGGSSAVVARNRIIGNSGYGLYVTEAVVEDNLIANSIGPGVYLGSLARLRDCTIVHSTSHGLVTRSTAREINRCVIAFNGGQAIACETTSSGGPALLCSVVFGNGIGGLCVEGQSNVILADPLFCSVTGDGAYHPRSGSPCAPENNPCGQLIGVFPVADCAPAAAAVCPPDTTVPLDPAGMLVPVSVFGIRNTAGQPLSFSYALTSTGPGQLVPLGGAESLAGSTPLLQPGESFNPPFAAVFAPQGQSAFTQLLHFDVRLGSEINASCEMSVRFEQAVPVALSGLQARLQGRDVRLTWLMGGTDDTGGSEVVVRRRMLEDTPGATMIIATLLYGASDYTDTTVEPGRRHEYDVAIVNNGEVTAVSNAVQIHVPALALAFASTSPNPFRTSTRVAFSVPDEGVVNLEVFDVHGRRVHTLLSGTMNAGTYWVDLAGDSPQWTSGVYFLRLSQGNRSVRTKVTLLR